jgi:geranylgeranyl pyrophosphate synthase
MSQFGFDAAGFDELLLRSAREGGPIEVGEALTHTLEGTAKRLRPVLVHLFGRICAADPDRMLQLALAVEMLHTATLVHDDLIDEAATRRGRPALHRVESPSVALLVGDLYLARCGVHLAQVAEPRATHELFGALATIVRGELLQRRRRFDLDQTEAEYMDTIRRKTASLVQAACVSAVIVAGGGADQAAAARRFGHHAGIAFQVIDDVLDYAAEADVLGKPVGNDIREGTVTLPLILTIADGPAVVGAIEAAKSSGDFSAVIRAVRDGGALRHCEALAADHARLARDALAVFPESAERAQLGDLAASLVSRSR